MIEKNTPPHIHIEKIQYDGKDSCETSMYGDVDTLISLIYSAMKSNPDFAYIIFTASANVYMENLDKDEIRKATLN